MDIEKAMNSVSIEPEGMMKVEVEEIAYSPEIELADEVLTERSQKLAATSTPYGSRWSCTVTQGYYVHSDARVQQSVKTVMARMGNVVSATQFKNKLRNYSQHLRGRLTGTQVNYLLGSAVSTSLKYNGPLSFTNGAKVSWYTTTSKFIVSSKDLCAHETQNLLGNVNGTLSSFWATIVAGICYSAAMGILMTLVLIAFPELAAPTAGIGAWDIAGCAAGFVGAIVYEAAVIGGQINYQTALKGLVACALSVGAGFIYRGKFAGTIAPWLTSIANSIRNGVARIWWYSSSSVADNLFNTILTREIELVDLSLPVEEVLVRTTVSTTSQGRSAGGVLAVPVPVGP